MTRTGEHPIDVLVLATGYDAISGTMLRLNPKGRGGVSLKERWQDRFHNYLGMTVAGFPNLFMIHGPGSPGVFYNMPLGAERQLNWIGNFVRHLREHDLGAVEPTTDSEEAWANEVSGIANATLFPRTDSWWTGANVEGKPRYFSAYLGGSIYYMRIADVADKDYAGFAFAAAQPAGRRQGVLGAAALEGLRGEQPRARQGCGPMHVGRPVLRQGQHRHHRGRRRVDRDRDLMPPAIVASRQLAERTARPADPSAHGGEGTDHAASVALVGAGARDRLGRGRVPGGRPRRRRSSRTRGSSASRSVGPPERSTSSARRVASGCSPRTSARWMSAARSWAPSIAGDGLAPQQAERVGQGSAEPGLRARRRPRGEGPNALARELGAPLPALLEGHVARPGRSGTG